MNTQDMISAECDALKAMLLAKLVLTRAAVVPYSEHGPERVC